MRVAFVLSRFPYDLTKGDKLRAYHHIIEVSKKHDVLLICVSDRKVDEASIDQLKPYCEEIHVIRLNRLFILLNLVKGLFHKLPFQVLYFYQKSAQKEIDRLIETRLPRHIFCQLIRSSEYVKKYHIIPSTLDYMDAFSKGIERRKNKAWWLLKPLFKAEFERLKRYEADIFKHFKHKTIISDQDRHLIQHPKNHQIQIMKNGVDLSFFTPQAQKEKKFDICFVGNMSYPPNIQAAKILAHQVLPALQKKKPDANLLIAGADPVVAVKRLESKHVHIAGWLEDIRDAYSESRIFIAPMKIGTGLQNKILEAMALGIPCITTNLANKAIQATHLQHLLIGESSEEMAELAYQLLKENQFYSSIQQNGLTFVQKHYSWSANTEVLQEILQESNSGTSVDNVDENRNVLEH